MQTRKKSFCKFLPLGAAADTAALINLAIFFATRKKTFYSFKIKKVCSYCEEIYENLYMKTERKNNFTKKK